MNKHFATMGDVWKHLPLAEILRLNPPKHYWETHAGSATYLLTPSPPREHGALHFLDHAQDEPDLIDCAYLDALQAMPNHYPGSPMLAARALGRHAEYLFCDIDPESAADLRSAMSGLDARVVEADGVTAVAQEAHIAGVDPAGVLVIIDPFDPHERWTPDSMTPIELASRLAMLGCRVFFWYAYDDIARRGWARDEIAELAPGAELWCGDTLMPISYIYPDRSGTWGCGIVLTNATPSELDACERLGQALERIGKSDCVPGNIPDCLTFTVLE